VNLLCTYLVVCGGHGRGEIVDGVVWNGGERRRCRWWRCASLRVRPHHPLWNHQEMQTGISVAKKAITSRDEQSQSPTREKKGTLAQRLQQWPDWMREEEDAAGRKMLFWLEGCSGGGSCCAWWWSLPPALPVGPKPGPTRPHRSTKCCCSGAGWWT
jgi:hypothetical protein